jgi:hypothetical protein
MSDLIHEDWMQNPAYKAAFIEEMTRLEALEGRDFHPMQANFTFPKASEDVFPAD